MRLLLRVEVVNMSVQVLDAAYEQAEYANRVIDAHHEQIEAAMARGVSDYIGRLFPGITIETHTDLDDDE